MKSNAEISRHRSSGSISISAIRNLLPRSGSAKKKMANPKLSRFNCENVPPVDPNIEVGELRSILKESTGKISVSGKETTEMAELEPQQHEEEPLSADPHVKVVARIRPPNSHERGDYTVRKVSDDSVSVGDRKFTLDAVIDSKSSQEDVFQLVGVPMVKSAMAGYNTSILAYGQTGSGKTYTLWGPPSAMVEDQSANGNQGIVPRIFQMLFTEIQRERDQAEGKQINYQCRCSFLEIYNDQIGDLLDPTQRNLEIKDDAKHGFYVENLTEEYVTGYEDVTQILIKGLSNKKVGATSINSKSSRSHIVLTCVIESWCKGSSKTSRITLVDLAGLEKNRTNDAGKECAREGEFVKKSISQLGNLVNILAGTNQSGLSKDIPYNNSCLTHLLRESLGGNSKLIVICAISPDDKCSGETISTLRFGHRAKLIHNNPVVNKITEDDVNDLSDQIRELKEELIRAKSDASYSIGSNTNYKGGSVRQSLNQLRVSLNRSLILPQIDNNDVKEELHIDEHDVRDLRLQLDMLHSSCDEEFQETSESTRFFSMGGCDDLASEQYASCQEESENEEIISEEPEMDLGNPKVINISAGRPSDVFNGPTLSESPKIGNAIRKSMISDQIRSSLRSSKMFGGPTESLAASLQRGLDIIDNHQRSSVLNKSLVALSFEHLATKTNDASVQTSTDESPNSYICSTCHKKALVASNDVQDSLKTWIVTKNEPGNSDESNNEIAAETMKKVKDLENLCMEQVAEIEKLNQLVLQYKQEKEGGTSLLDELRNGKISRNSETKVKCQTISFDTNEKESLLQEIKTLRSKLQSPSEPPSSNKSIDRLRSSSLLSQSLQLRKSGAYSRNEGDEELQKERERWTEMESEWICLTDELRVDLEANRRHAEKVEMELRLEKKCTEELDDALMRSIAGHGKMVEHYADLQEKYNELVEKHRLIMEGIAEVKRAAAKAGAKGHGKRFSKSLAAELSVLRVEREKERELLKKENRSLKIQLRDTAEAVHAAGELLVRLREAEETASVAQENVASIQEENDKLKKQVDKQKRKHKMEMITMKQYLAESRLPESALRPLYREDSDVKAHDNDDDDQAWRAEFGAIYQDHY
ncbi:kinesin-like protein KIN-12F [Cynara cardunculus var. scolymus]|uniref:kinesin-like protein KIN-12F n=1 Tax=Cynara cardunculus var. scolymus TaxID=59895 RepID=UPI000D6314C6|nr:kinesin-like protein KIN-12F [Cynara cardunculus var. scolymus]